MLLDPETYAAAPGVERLLGPPGLKTELFSCLVETNTAGLRDAPRRRRPSCAGCASVVREAAAREGLVVAATGSHPFSRPEEQEIVQRAPLSRSARGATGGEEPARLRPARARRDDELRALPRDARVRPAVAAGGARRLAQLAVPRGREQRSAVRARRPAPRAAAGGRAAAPGSGRAGRRRSSEAGGDYTRIWWDVRPHPRLGTLEVRMPDQPTSVRRSAALAALVQALCASAEPGPPADRGAFAEARADAAAGRAPVAELLALVEPAARELDTWELVESLREPAEAHAPARGRRAGRDWRPSRPTSSPIRRTRR